MKLYAFQPRGHGEFSFFVCAASEEEARQAVDAHIRQRKQQHVLAIERCDYESDCRAAGWGTDYYELTVFEPGQVAENDND